MDMARIDPNLKVECKISRENVSVFDVRKAPFQLHGIIPPTDAPEDKFRRIPEATALSVSKNVHWLHANTTGARLRFRTNSSYIAIHAEMPCIWKYSHDALTGCAGFDLYAFENGRETYAHTFIPPYSIENGFESEYTFPEKKMRELTLHFPLFSEVSKLYLYLDADAEVEPPRQYKHTKPVVYYGSSITHGGCASRPGNTYEAIISRMLDCDFLNLGFNGNAKAEDEIAAYIANLDMSVFVYDYDYNAPDADHLRKTHERMFRIIRNKQPTLPIICASRPNYSGFPEDEERRQIIMQTVGRAKAAGDANVIFVDGKEYFSDCYTGCELVDGCHPTDVGFLRMAEKIGKEIAVFLDKNP